MAVDPHFRGRRSAAHSQQNPARLRFGCHRAAVSRNRHASRRAGSPVVGGEAGPRGAAPARHPLPRRAAWPGCCSAGQPP